MLLLHRLYLLILGCCLVFTVQAQTPVVYNLKGIICSKGSTNRVGYVLITDKQSKVNTLSNDVGLFNIKAAVGDTLLFTRNDYTSVYQVVFGPADIIMFMQKVVMLNTVTVQGQTKQQELSEAMDSYRAKGVYDGGTPSALSAIFNPINGLHDLFGKDAANARHFAAYAKQEQEASEDHGKYNKELVKKITGLPDADVEKFMEAFKPSHEDLQKWNSYDVIAYIKKSLESYKKFGAPAVQKLY